MSGVFWALGRTQIEFFLGSHHGQKMENKSEKKAELFHGVYAYRSCKTQRCLKEIESGSDRPAWCGDQVPDPLMNVGLLAVMNSNLAFYFD